MAELLEEKRSWIKDFKPGASYLTNKVIRYSLSPIFAKNDYLTGASQLVYAYEKADRRWFSVVSRLAKAGLYPFTDSRRESFAKWCPPAGVYAENASRRLCRNYNVCPWCWARDKTLDLYHRVIFAIWQTAEVEGSTNLPYRVHVGQATQVEYWPFPETSVDRLFLRMYTHKKYVKELVPDALGAAQQFTLEPPDTRDKYPTWKLSTRMLVITSPDGGVFPETIPPHPQSGVKMSYSAKSYRPDERGWFRKHLIQPVGTMMIYPRQMLYGPVPQIAEILSFRASCSKNGEALTDPEAKKTTRGFRMSAYYGNLRNNKQRQQDLLLRPLEPIE